MDYMPQERERGITITAAATSCFWRGGYRKLPLHRINIIDTPGHVDFTAEVERSLRVLDGACAIFDGVAGVEPQSETVWRQANNYNIPRIAYVNKMDRMGANFENCLAEMREKLGVHPVPIFIPVGSAKDFVGVVDLICMKFYNFTYTEDSFNYVIEDIPAKMKDQVERYRAAMHETAAQGSEELLEKYLTDGSLSQDDVRRGLRILTLANKVVPVTCGSSLKNKNVQGKVLVIYKTAGFLDMIVDYLPSPCEANKLCVKSQGTEDVAESLSEKVLSTRQVLDDEYQLNFDIEDFDLPFAALVFKLTQDNLVGIQSFIRVYRGQVNVGDVIYNPRTKSRERVQKLMFMHSDQRTNIKSAHAGDIVSLVGIKDIITGDTICSEKEPILLQPINFPEPVISLHVETTEKGDDSRLMPVLSKFLKEDPSLRVHANMETGQTLISGMGELHLEVTVDRIRREHKLPLKTGAPQVAFKETLKSSATAEGKYIRQSGGRGQYGHVVVSIEPLPQGSGVEFQSAIVSGVIPQEYIPSVEAGAREQLSTGLLANYPVTDILVTLLDGSFHIVDSSDVAFRLATGIAIREAAKSAGVKLLEPIMKINIVCPNENYGTVIGDLKRRRGVVNASKDGYGGVKELKGEAPLMEMTGYMTALRSLSQGRGFFTMEMSHYRPVPPLVQEEIVQRIHSTKPQLKGD
ncbi:bifunctional Elongation Factor G [Babesia duncani]|uniref:Bifunctional Elongation Factor G n=1 Tax=Babesia duncani TaxID=323732 RepID=A0AAD9PLS9_9APIC|nr:bifunctional Elongation Factor G [Babesia duncani]